MPSDNFFTAYRDGAWETPSDDPASPWYDGPVVPEASGDQTARARAPRGGAGGIFSDPNSGDTVIIVGFHVTASADASCGGSGPESPRSPIGSSMSAGSTVTLLPTGTYRATCFLQSATLYGRSGVGASESAPFALVDGVSKPRLYMPYVPPSGTYWVVELTKAGGATMTERTYCQGVTGAYLDLVSALWGASYHAGKAENGVVSYDDNPSSGTIHSARETAALVIGAGGKVTIAAGKILTLRGDLVSELPDDSTADLVLIRGSGAGFCFDSTLAQYPTQTEYGVMGAGGNIGLRA